MTPSLNINSSIGYVEFRYVVDANDVDGGVLDVYPVTETGHIKYDIPIQKNLPLTVGSSHSTKQV